MFISSIFLPTVAMADCVGPSGTIPVGNPICDPSWNPYMKFKTVLACSERFSVDDIGCLIGGFIELLFIVGGVLAIIWIIIAGMRYMLAIGSPDKQAAAKDALYWAVIGLIVSLLAWAILNFVYDTITT